jgi:enamine deaminase RidA (YjgF/YER057c/UK114 family)
MSSLTPLSTLSGEHRPARAIIPVGNFGEGLLIEIEAIAALNEEQ